MEARKKFKIELFSDDLVRIAVALLLGTMIFFPPLNQIIDSIKEQATYARYEEGKAKLEAEFAEWNKKTNAEKFAWCVMDMAKEEGSIVEVDLDENNEIIYICCFTDKVVGDEFSVEREYLKAMTDFAVGSHVTEKIYLAGLNERKEVVWTMDDKGNVF